MRRSQTRPRDCSSDVVDANIKRRNLGFHETTTSTRDLAGEQGPDVRFRRRPDCCRASRHSTRRRGSWNRTVWSQIAPRSLQKCWRKTVSPRSLPLIERLASVVDPKRGKETYGELCQFYFTLRHGGADRDAALMQLRARYGSSGGSVRRLLK